MSAHLLLLTLIIAASPTADAQRGVVRGVRVSDSSFVVGARVAITVTGVNPCGAVELTYGDGKVVTHPIVEVPVTLIHTYETAGSYTLRARGVGNCDGEATVSLQVREAPGPETKGVQGRFAGLDTNRDGVITREEWQGNESSFRNQDWNRDGVLSGDETRPGAARPGEDDEWIDDEDDLDWTRSRHRILDRNRDGRITTAEWPYSRELFRRIDRNRNGSLSEREFLGEADDDRSGDEAPDADGVRTIVVKSTERWTDTGIDIQRGDVLTFDAAGTVQLSADGADVADPGGVRSGRSAPDAPVRRGLAGALIARVGTDAPIVVGGRSGPLRAPVSGRLFLGVNDDFLGDNRGAFRVRVTVEEPRRR